MTEIKTTVNPEKWVDEYADALFRYAMQRVEDTEQAKDLVQETFLSAYKSLANFEGKSTIKTWLFAILKRKIIDFYRQQETHKTIPLSTYFREKGRVGHWQPENQPKGKFAAFEEQLENTELYIAINKCIDLLPGKWKGIIIDKLVDQKETEIVCNEHEISASNFWVIIHRAKVQLRDCLERKWFND